MEMHTSFFAFHGGSHRVPMSAEWFPCEFWAYKDESWGAWLAAVAMRRGGRKTDLGLLGPTFLCGSDTSFTSEKEADINKGNIWIKGYCTRASSI